MSSRIIISYNIFESSFYMTNLSTKLKDVTKTATGRIAYHLSVDKKKYEEMKETYQGGVATTNIKCYLWKFEELYKKSLKLYGNEGFLIHGGKP